MNSECKICCLNIKMNKPLSRTSVDNAKNKLMKPAGIEASPWSTTKTIQYILIIYISFNYFMSLLKYIIVI